MSDEVKAARSLQNLLTKASFVLSVFGGSREFAVCCLGQVLTRLPRHGAKTPAPAEAATTASNKVQSSDAIDVLQLEGFQLLSPVLNGYTLDPECRRVSFEQQ